MRDDSFVNQLHNAETIIKDYKTKQNIAGDSWTVYRYQSPKQPYDIYVNGTTTSSTWVKRWKVTYQIEGGKNIPNAFAQILPKVDYLDGPFYGSPFPGGPIQMSYTARGFEYHYVDHPTDPLSGYLMLYAAWNWTSSASSWVGVTLRAISPYKGMFILQEVS